MKINEMVSTLIQAKAEYYKGTPIMTDSEFDKLEDELRALDATNSYFDIVGSSEDTQGNDIVHEDRMKSMDKGKNPKDAKKWLKKIGLTEKDVIKLPKIDGTAATCKYVDGKLVYVATRGDGSVGKDITHLAEYMDTIPKTITFTKEPVEVRGEVFLPKDTEYEYTGPLRNNAVGLMNRQSDKSCTHFLKFIAYRVVGGNFNTYENALKAIMADKFYVVDYDLGTDLAKYYKTYLATTREAWIYETDGIVLAVNKLTSYDDINSRWTDNSHHWFTNFAVKPPSKTATSILLEIIYQMSRQGNLIPVGLFTPVEINGATIERATLNNYKHVNKLLLNIGDKITVILNNDVIPGIEENISARGRDAEGFKSDSTPTICPYCGSVLQSKGVHLHCGNKDCKEQEVVKLIYWIDKSDVKDVGESMIRALHTAGKLKTVTDVYTITSADMSGIEGIGAKKSENFVKVMAEDRTIRPVDLLSRMNIPLVRDKALKKLGIKTVEEFMTFTGKGFTTQGGEPLAIVTNILEWRSDIENVNLLGELSVIMNVLPPESDVVAKGKICITGKGCMPRKELEALITERGYEPVKTLNKETDILIIADPNSTSSKAVKARKNGTKLMSYEEFIND